MTAEQIQHYIDALPSGLFRVKAALFSDGLELSHAAVSELDGQQYVILSEHTLSQRDYLRRFKTTRREIFDQAWKTAEGQGAFDSLFSIQTVCCQRAEEAMCSSNIKDNGSRRLWIWIF